MSCPFLREGRARYCHAAPLRKLILDGPGSAGTGRCETPDYRQCPLVEAQEAAARCPHLEGIHVQYCGATGVPKLVPFSEAGLSRCGGPGFRYCDLYLSMARPHTSREPSRDLYFTDNHLWLDTDESGLCQVGLDSMLARVMGSIDSLTYETVTGTGRPTVMLSLGGMEWMVEFPNPLRITAVNGHLRQNPVRAVDDPYGSGWLFEGWEVPGQTRDGLRRGAEAAGWLSSEEHRLTEFLQQNHDGSHSAVGVCMGDGGEAAHGVARLLARKDAHRLYHEFFAPVAARKKED